MEENALWSANWFYGIWKPGQYLGFFLPFVLEWYSEDPAGIILLWVENIQQNLELSKKGPPELKFGANNWV